MRTQLLFDGTEERVDPWSRAIRESVDICKALPLKGSDFNNAVFYSVMCNAPAMRMAVKQVFTQSQQGYPFDTIFNEFIARISSLASTGELPRPETLERSRRKALENDKVKQTNQFSYFGPKKTCNGL